MQYRHAICNVMMCYACVSPVASMAHCASPFVPNIPCSKIMNL